MTADRGHTSLSLVMVHGNYEAFKDHMRKQKGEHWKPTRVRYRLIRLIKSHLLPCDMPTNFL